MQLFRKCHAESIFSDLEFDDLRARRALFTAATFARGYVRVLEHRDHLVGCLVGVIDQNQFGVPCAQDLFTYAERGTHLLIRDFLRWCEDTPAVFVQMTDYSRNPRYGELLQKLGLQPSGVAYMRGLSNG